MNRRHTVPQPDPDGHKVYVGVLVPLTLYSRLAEEAEAAGVSRSEVLRRALAERYGDAEAG